MPCAAGDRDVNNFGRILRNHDGPEVASKDGLTVTVQYNGKRGTVYGWIQRSGVLAGGIVEPDDSSTASRVASANGTPQLATGKTVAGC